MSDRHYTPRPKMSRKKFWGLVLMLVFLFLVLLVVMSPVVMKCSKKATMTTSISNAKQISMLLFEFDQDFGEFPSDKTALMEADFKGYQGEYSNDYLGQFIAGGYTNSEEIFYAKGGSSVKKRPDNDISTRANILEAGECGFAYMKGLNTTDYHTETPVLMAPMYGDGYRFNPDVYHGKAVALRLNGSVKTLRIDSNHHAVVGGGRTLFQKGPGTVWDKKWGGEGKGMKVLNPKNLCYAKYPYVYQKPVKKSQVVWVVVVSVIGFFLIYLGMKRRRSSIRNA